MIYQVNSNKDERGIQTFSYRRYASESNKYNIKLGWASKLYNPLLNLFF